MQFEIKNIGRLDEAKLDIASLTVICGPNNTGKTYATYALYGFLKTWAQTADFPHPLAVQAANSLPQSGVLRIDLAKELLPTCADYVTRWSQVYAEALPKVFASRQDYFANSEVLFVPDSVKVDLSGEFNQGVKVGTHTALIFSKEKDSDILEITRPTDATKHVPNYAVASIIDGVFRKLVWNQMVPDVYISSTERTGAAVFHRSLNFARDKAMDALMQLEKQHDTEAFVTNLFLNHRSDYPMPVEENVRLLGNLESVAKEKGKVSIEHPEIIAALDEIVGGAYKSTKEGVFYFPKGTKVKLSMAESSSIVRSLLDFSFYLRHQLKAGDLLIVDEPELSLHPGNQRLLTRLLVRLVNAGVKVLVTTHSDYIVRELNALIVMKSLGERFASQRKKRGYDERELLDSSLVRVYTAEEQKIKGSRKPIQTLVRREVDPCEGMAIKSFDDQIEALNELQDALILAASEREDGPC
jgi:ABC-type multidrug transport system ATPase subunit